MPKNPENLEQNPPKLDIGENGPDDGGYEELRDSGTPEGFDAIMDAVTHESMGEIPPSHVHEDLRDSIRNEDQVTTSSTETISPFSEETFVAVEEKGIEREFLDPLTLSEQDLDTLAKYSQTIADSATRVANATSFSEIEEEADELTAHINQIEEPLGKELLKRIQELYEIAS